MIKNYGNDPATRHYTVSPSNTATLSPAPRFLYVATNGNVTIVDDANTAVTYAVTAGQVLKFRAVKINTDSTANVVAWY